LAKIDGLSGLTRKLNKLKTAPRASIAAALDASADDMVRTMRRIAPKDKGALQASIRKEKYDDGLTVVVRAGGPLTTKAVRKGVKAKDVAAGVAKVEPGGAAEKGVYDYALAVEFGFRTEDGGHVPAQSFFFPTVRVKRKSVKTRVSRALGQAIKAEGGEGGQ
jgi:HK97 gp10 family phage protein